MKLKEIDRSGIISFSPVSLSTTYLAIGTSLHKLDGSFNSLSQLDIFEYNPSLNGLDMELKQTLSLDTKLAKLLWSGNSRNGLIISGGEAGNVALYDPGESLKDKSQPIVRLFDTKAHKGVVNALDNNKSVKNLFASGGTESEIFIWDIEKLEDPVALDQKSQPVEDILGLAWNHKVEQVLGSVSSHRCQVWDLRKTNPVIKLSDTQMKIKPRKMLWHPEISRRLCLVSNDDYAPSIQMWDLRYLQCPYHTLHYSAPILDIDWSLDDPDILVTITKDDHIICYDMATHPASNGPAAINTNSVRGSHYNQQQQQQSLNQSEVIYKHQCGSQQQSLSEVKFCPKHPSVIAVSSLDCHVSLYSLMGGISQSHVSTNQIDSVSDSFPLDENENDDQHADEFELIKQEVEKEAAKQLTPYPCLSKAPKWLRRSCGASFSFGGKLIQWSKPDSSRSRCNSTSQSEVRHDSAYSRKHPVVISRVTTNPNLLEKSMELCRVLGGSQDDLVQYCDERTRNNTNADPDNDVDWEPFIWKFILCHLMEDSRSAFVKTLGYERKPELDKENNSDKGTDHESESGSVQGSIHADKEGGNGDISLVPSDSEYDKEMSVFLMTGDIRAAVKLCMQHEKYGEACILAVSSGQQDLYDEVQRKVLRSLRPTHYNENTSDNASDGNDDDNSLSLIEVAVNHDWEGLVSRCTISDWMQALVWLMTYCSEEEDELAQLCTQLGSRLLSAELLLPAAVAFVCAGSLSQFVDTLLLHYTQVFTDPECTQKVMEMVLMLCQATGSGTSDLSIEGSHLVVHYCELLVSLGNCSGALQHITTLSPHASAPRDSELQLLTHRLMGHLGNVVRPPPFPVQLLFKPPPTTITAGIPSNMAARSIPPTHSLSASYSSGVSSARISNNTTVPQPHWVNSSNYNTNMLPKQPISPSHNPASFFNPASNNNPVGVIPTSNINPSLPGPPKPHGQIRSSFSSSNSNSSNNRLLFAQGSPLHTAAGNITATGTVVAPPVSPTHFLSSAAGLQQPTARITSMPPPDSSLSFGARRSVTAKTGQSGWNDPPILSEAYYDEKRRVDSDSSNSRKFYNPNEFSHSIPAPHNGTMPMMTPTGVLPTVNSARENNDTPVSNAGMITTPGEKVPTQMQSCDTEKFEPIKTCLLDLLSRCRIKDTSRMTKVKLDDLERKLDAWFESLSTMRVSEELYRGLCGVCDSIKSSEYKQSVARVNTLSGAISFSEASSFLPALKMLLQTSRKIMA